MSMTDEQIVKALECCENEINFCSICPYFLQNKENDFCKEDMAKDALSLIKRQQAEIEKLNIDLDAMRCAANSLKMHYDKAKSEAVWDIATEYEAYKEAVEVALVETRAEAVREFAERLKKLKYQSSDWSHGEHPFVVEETDIDELVIEMTEEK